MQQNKRKIFENVVFEVFKNEQEYDKTHYQLMRAYDIYSKKVKGFIKLSPELQYSIVNTACIMAMGSSLRQLRTIEILTRNKPVHDIERDYSPEYGYVEPSKLTIKETKKLLQCNNQVKR